MGAFLKWNNGESELFFDVVTTETQNQSNTITEHPVEIGADITDHVRPNLAQVTIEGFISNTPVFDDKGSMSQVVLDTPDPPTPINLNGAIDALSSAINPKAQVVANVFTFPSAPDFVADVISTLETLKVGATLVDIHCPSRVYQNMLIEEFEVDRDASSGTGATIKCQFREIRTVQTSIVQAPEPTIQRGNENVQKGSQAGEKPEDKKKSALKAIQKLVGG